MRIIFSRKGFDSSSGGGASPIIKGKPVSLPIPAKHVSQTTYNDLGLGELVNLSSRGQVKGSHFCHYDPMFTDQGQCFFGQCGAAQTHLERQGVCEGDVFLFFGLFRDFQNGGEPHHRIFAYLEVEQVMPLADDVPQELLALSHPHALAMHHKNDVVYRGPGKMAVCASDALRLTVLGGPLTLWERPCWLRHGGLSYHDKKERWVRGGLLKSVARGQEFVADIGRKSAAREWLGRILDEIRGF
jgi:hypothetical protein